MGSGQPHFSVAREASAAEHGATDGKAPTFEGNTTWIAQLRS
jgi:hypothetical protein